MSKTATAKRKTARKPKASPVRNSKQKHHVVIRSKEVVLVIIGAMALFLLLALATYHRTDPGWSFQSANVQVQNAAGRLGAYLADMTLAFLGFFGYLLPFLMAYGVWVIYREPRREASEPLSLSILFFRVLGGVLTFFAGSGLSALIFDKTVHLLPQGPGGIIGSVAIHTSMSFLNYYGSLLVLIAFLLIGFTLYGGLSWVSGLSRLALSVKNCALMCYSRAKVAWLNFREAQAKAAADRSKEKLLKAKEAVQSRMKNFSAPAPKIDRQSLTQKRTESKLDIVKPKKVETTPSQATTSKLSQKAVKSGKLPSVDLLDMPDSKPQELSNDALEHMARLTEEKLADFGVAVKVVGACPGPVITRFELQLAPGVKVSKLSNLSKDLARSLSAHSVRVVEVIPGKSYVGLEIPNDTRQTVRLREVLDSKAYRDHPSTLAMGLGLDIAGEPEFADLQKMPHLLVAGTTGSGKSVGLNAMLLSLLLKAKPDELRLIMIDPKMLELSVYEGIPHLLTPVVTDMKEAANALRWCVKEMDERYQLLAALGVRNIKSFNEKVVAAEKSGSPIMNPLKTEGEPEPLRTMPYIVVLVDEFADMIMVVGKKVEELITRIAQKARAAGIHLILATQRPSVDVITGLIKANVPSRIAFQVSSKIDSRTILDQPGAEQLLGYGDMLYLPPGSGHPNRVHGAFVADHEVHAIVEAWRAQGEPDYIEDIIKTVDPSEEGGAGGSDKDELYDEAVRIVVESQRASISAVQRRLRIGYNRAARLIEDMEAAGIVSEIMPNGMREVLMK